VLVLAGLATGLNVLLFPSLTRFKAKTVSWLLRMTRLVLTGSTRCSVLMSRGVFSKILLAAGDLWLIDGNTSVSTSTLTTI
jgi:hypothetical protein